MLLAAVQNSAGQVSAEELQRAVRASSSPDAPVIEITGSASTARRSADLSNAVANGLISTANQRSADTRVRLVLLSPALPPSAPVSLRPDLDTAVGAAAGLVLGGLALLARPGRVRPGPATEVADDGGVETADGVRMEEIQRWTGTAPVIVAGRSKPAGPAGTARPERRRRRRNHR